MRSFYIIILIVCLFYHPALADAPLPPPGKETVCNLNNTFCAVSDPTLNKITIIRKKTNDVLWEMPGWQRWIYISSDGNDILIYYGNLVNTDATAQQQVLRFFHRGKLTRAVTLADLFHDLSVLQRTASHLKWGGLDKITSNDRAHVTLVDGRHIAFDMRTGRDVKE